MNSFTKDLVVWIEKNLDTKVGLDEVAAKAGYSKWYLQRIFKAETGIPMANYIRHRKLYKAAIMLKLTDLSVIDITERMSFSSQQTFTRTFKRHFGMSPGRYRSSQEWYFDGLMPMLTNKTHSLPVPEMINESINYSSVTELSYNCLIDDIDCEQFHIEQRIRILAKARKIIDKELPVSVAIKYEPATKNTSSVKIRVFFFVKNTNHKKRSLTYIRFPFQGDLKGLTQMQLSIYHHVMPQRKEARIMGEDIFISDSATSFLNGSTLRGYYYIPVKHHRCLR